VVAVVDPVAEPGEQERGRAVVTLPHGAVALLDAEAARAIEALGAFGGVEAGEDTLGDGQTTTEREGEDREESRANHQKLPERLRPPAVGASLTAVPLGPSAFLTKKTTPAAAAPRPTSVTAAPAAVKASAFLLPSTSAQEVPGCACSMSARFTWPVAKSTKPVKATPAPTLVRIHPSLRLLFGAAAGSAS